MKHPVLCPLMAAVFWIVSIPQVPAQWVQTNGPNGANVYALAFNGTCLFAHTDNGVSRSTDNGSSWGPVDLGFSQNEYVTALSAVGAKVFVCTQNVETRGNLSLCSTDHGLSWNTVAGLPHFYSVCESGTDFIASSDRGIFLSTDAGRTWAKGYQSTHISALVSNGQNLFAGIEVLGVLLSTDNGRSWTAVNEGLPRSEPDTTRYAGVSCLASGGPNLYAGVDGHGVFVSTNSGTSWSAANAGLPAIGDDNRFSRIISLVVTGPNVFAGTSGGVFLSTNNGTSWTEVSPHISRFPQIRCLAVSSTGLFLGTGNPFFGGGAGVWFTSDNGAAWATANSGLTEASVTCLAVNDTRLFAGVLGAGGYTSTDNGDTWTQIGLETEMVLSFAFIGTHIFASTSTMMGENGVFRSTDAGTTWTAVNDGLPRNKFDATRYAHVERLASSGQNLFAASSSGVFRSSNEGASWTEANAGLTDTDVRDLAVSDTVLFAGTSSGVFRSTDSGTSWTWTSTGLPAMAYFYALAVDGMYIFASTDSGVFRSEDSGASWTFANSGLPTDRTFSSFAVNESGIFVGEIKPLHGRGVFYSTNHGTVWAPFDEGLPTPDDRRVYGAITCLASSRKHLFAGTGVRSVWRRPLSEIITAVDGSSELPGEFVIHQNYPNPFNPRTTIPYALPKSSVVRLTVYDMLGRQVSLLANERKEAGYHEVKFDASGLSTGVYLYRIQAGSYVETKRLLILR